MRHISTDKWQLNYIILYSLTAHDRSSVCNRRTCGYSLKLHVTVLKLHRNICVIKNSSACLNEYKNCMCGC